MSTGITAVETFAQAYHGGPRDPMAFCYEYVGLIIFVTSRKVCVDATISRLYTARPLRRVKQAGPVDRRLFRPAFSS